MGIICSMCPSLSPQERVIKKKNAQIKKQILYITQDLAAYNFTYAMRVTIKNMANRYLLNEGILQDIDKLLFMTKQGYDLDISNSASFSNFQQQVRNSCLILEDQAIEKQNRYQRMGSISQSFQKNMDKNQSLVVQINIIYQNQFDQKKYKKSLHFFLKWASIYQQHSYGGFLKPIYRQFCQCIYSIPKQDLDIIIDQTRIFVQFMVSILTDIYKLKQLNASVNGDLFKNENVFNLVMSFLFKRTKINRFVRKIILINEEQKINLFRTKLQEIHTKSLDYFGIPKKFLLNNHQQSIINVSLSTTRYKQRPYQRCIKMIVQLCQENQTPITKLKIIVAISKKIITQIYQHYKEEKIQVPQVDPDAIMSIIIYIIAKANNYLIYQQLKLVQCFTTTNCMNSISGYYLNTFIGAIQTILNM